MSNYDLFVALGNVNFGINDNHRYQNIDSKFIIKQSLSNARMIKNNMIDINLAFDVLNSFNYGYYHTKIDSKKYYFFITSIDYINDAVTRISFKIDWFSTDYKNITFTNSFVERMHPTLDSLANYPRTKENIGNQYPLTTKYVDKFELDYTNAYFIIATTHAIPTKRDLSHFYEIDNANILDKIGGIFEPIEQKLHSGELNYTYITTNNFTEVNTFIKNALSNGFSNSIGGIWRVPSLFANYTETYTINVSDKFVLGGYSETVNILQSSERILQLSANGFIFEYPTSVDNYTPFYKKCLDYQYINPCILANDSQIVYNYSYFKTQENQNNVINLFFDCKGDANIYIVPYQYNGSNEHDFTNCATIKISVPVQISTDNSVYIKDAVRDITNNWQNRIVTGGFSIVDYVADKYTELKNAKTKDKDNVLTDIPTDIIHGITNTSKNIVDDIYSLYNVGRGVTIVGGTGNTTISKLSDYGQNIHFGFVSYSNTDIQKVDRYFSMFGYNYSQLMIPTLRNSYTFLQGDINFIGNINNESFTEIKNLFYGGLTIWNETELYNYDVQ